MRKQSENKGLFLSSKFYCGFKADYVYITYIINTHNTYVHIYKKYIYLVTHYLISDLNKRFRTVLKMDL